MCHMYFVISNIVRDLLLNRSTVMLQVLCYALDD